jgi:hypothetical protein
MNDEKTETGSDAQMTNEQHDRMEQRYKDALAKERAEDLQTEAIDVDDSTEDISGDESQVN